VSGRLFAFFGLFGVFFHKSLPLLRPFFRQSLKYEGKLFFPLENIKLNLYMKEDKKKIKEEFNNIKKI
jgi:hypothetical protein